MNVQLAQLWLIGAELAIGVAAGVWFVIAYARSAWSRSPAGRHLMAMSVVMAGGFLTLLAMLVGIAVPLWVFVAGFGFADVVLVHRLVLYYRAQRIEHAAQHAADGSDGREASGYGTHPGGQ